MKHNHNLCQEKKKECHKTWSETQQKSRPTATASRPTYQQKLCVSWSSKRRLHSFKVSAYDCPKENGAEHSRSDVLKESYLRSWIATFSANANLHSFTHLIPFGLLFGFLKISCYSTWWFCPPHSASPSNLRQAWEMTPREDLFADEVSALPRAFDGLWLESYVAGMCFLTFDIAWLLHHGGHPLHWPVSSSLPNLPNRKPNKHWPVCCQPKACQTN